MPALIIDCPFCSRKLRVPEELLGKAVRCPTCEHTFQATAELGSPSSPSPPPPATETATIEQPSAPVPEEEQSPSEPIEQSRPCPMCGEPNEPDATRCQFCGEEFAHREGEDDRPWEQSQQFPRRRDAEPHRGTLILVLGIISIVVSAIGGCVYGLGGVIGLPLGIAAWVMGHRDLHKMRQNLMDREGEGLTQAGWICGIIGTIFSAVCSIAFLVAIAFFFTMFATARRAPPQRVPPAAPAPVRPAPAPAPAPPGNRAALQEAHQRSPHPGRASQS